MYEVDFLPVEAEDGPSSKSGDAITVRFTKDLDGSQKVVVIDAGFKSFGQQVVEHVRTYYGTSRVDLLISTHPDSDHLNGLQTVVEELDVVELLVHRPELHVGSVTDFSNLEALQSLLDAADSAGTKITEPFTGLSYFEDQVTILGPTATFYEEKLAEHLSESRSGVLGGALAHAVNFARDLLSRKLSFYPTETLGDDGVTGPRNETSVVTLIRSAGKRLLFTGDAGLEGLGAAVDQYESTIGLFSDHPLSVFHVPHHGSRRNVSPGLLDRIIGPIGTSYGAPSAVVSSAAADKKHPSPKVTNALGRRGAEPVATEGRTILSSDGIALRSGWGPAAAIGPLAEDY